MKRYRLILPLICMLLIFWACNQVNDSPATESTAGVTDTDPSPTESEEGDPAETNSLETDPTESNPADTNPNETNPTETNSPETNPPETNSPETNPPETNSPETNPPETFPSFDYNQPYEIIEFDVEFSIVAYVPWNHGYVDQYSPETHIFESHEEFDVILQLWKDYPIEDDSYQVDGIQSLKQVSEKYDSAWFEDNVLVTASFIKFQRNMDAFPTLNALYYQDGLVWFDYVKTRYDFSPFSEKEANCDEVAFLFIEISSESLKMIDDVRNAMIPPRPVESDMAWHLTWYKPWDQTEEADPPETNPTQTDSDPKFDFLEPYTTIEIDDVQPVIASFIPSHGYVSQFGDPMISVFLSSNDYITQLERWKNYPVLDASYHPEGFPSLDEKSSKYYDDAWFEDHVLMVALFVSHWDRTVKTIYYQDDALWFDCGSSGYVDDPDEICQAAFVFIEIRKDALSEVEDVQAAKQKGDTFQRRPPLNQPPEESDTDDDPWYPIFDFSKPHTEVEIAKVEPMFILFGKDVGYAGQSDNLFEEYISSQQDFIEFKDRMIADGILADPDYKAEGFLSFSEAVEAYDEAWFEDNVLIFSFYSTYRNRSFGGVLTVDHLYVMDFKGAPTVHIDYYLEQSEDRYHMPLDSEEIEVAVALIEIPKATLTCDFESVDPWGWWPLHLQTKPKERYK